MKTRIYYLVDNYGKVFYKWPFHSKYDAYSWASFMGRPDWNIIEK